MAKPCYCGCGMEIPLGRRRIANRAAAQYARDLALCKGLLERDPAHANDPELQAIVAEGERWMPDVRKVVHGEIDRKDVDREAIRVEARNGLPEGGEAAVGRVLVRPRLRCSALQRRHHGRRRRQVGIADAQ